MFKYLILLFLCGGAISNAYAQGENVYFINSKGAEVTVRDSAEYIRIVTEPEAAAESSLFTVKEYFMNGSPKSVGYSSIVNPPFYEGQRLEYHRNGKRKRLSTYTNGKKSGSSYTYFPNGKLHSVLAYSGEEMIIGSSYLITELKDSLGNVLVTNSEGSVVFYDDEFQQVVDSGQVKNGVKVGNWTGYRIAEKLSYSENYVNGKLVSGESTDDTGKKYSYTTEFQGPAFKGGIDKFYTYLKYNIRYPSEAVQRRATGVAQVKFSVKSNGKIADVKVINSIDADLAREAARVIQNSPDWIPGALYGKPFNTIYHVPVTFSLQQR